jgi:hypothetical protein
MIAGGIKHEGAGSPLDIIPFALFANVVIVNDSAISALVGAFASTIRSTDETTAPTAFGQDGLSGDLPIREAGRGEQLCRGREKKDLRLYRFEFSSLFPCLLGCQFGYHIRLGQRPFLVRRNDEDGSSARHDDSNDRVLGLGVHVAGLSLRISMTRHCVARRQA